MTLSRLISPDTRSGLLIALGATLILAPTAMGLSSAAMVTGVAVGAIAVGLGLAGTASGGRGTIPVGAQMAYDQGLAFGLAISGLAFGAIGEPLALALFTGAGLVHLLVSALTRYSTRPAPQDFL